LKVFLLLLLGLMCFAGRKAVITRDWWCAELFLIPKHCDLSLEDCFGRLLSSSFREVFFVNSREGENVLSLSSQRCFHSHEGNDQAICDQPIVIPDNWVWSRTSQSHFHRGIGYKIGFLLNCFWMLDKNRKRSEATSREEPENFCPESADSSS
jgi:hypothetical protein